MPFLKKSWSSLLFDGVWLVLIGIWFSGGISFQDHLYFKHGADPRRAAMIWAVLGYGCFKGLRQTSLVLSCSARLGALLSIRWFRWGTYGVCCLGAVLLSVAQALAMRVTLWDVGLFHQILWSLAHGLGFYSTISGAGDFLTDHFAPSLVLLVPFFQLSGESPLFLPVVQVLLVFGGGAAWIFLAERSAGAERLREGNGVKTSSNLAAATTIFILGFDSLWRNMRWGFHENAIAFCSLSWAMALLFTSSGRNHPSLKKVFILVLFLIAAGSKEILLLDIGVGFAVWSFWEGVGKKSPIKFRILKILISLALISGFVLFEKIAHPPNKNYFNRYYAYLGANLPEFLSNLVSAPGLVFQYIGLKPLVRYFWVVFFPVLFLIPAVLKKSVGARVRFSVAPEVLWVLMIVPSFASAALASFPPLRDPGFHYVLELWPVLVCVTLMSLARQKSASLCWAWALMSLITWDFDPIAEYREYQSQRPAQVSVRELIDKIPPGAAVMADEFAGTWVSGRRWVTRWPDVKLLPLDCPEYVLIQGAGDLKNTDLLALISRCQKGVGSISASVSQKREVQRTGDWSLYRIAGI